MTLKAELHQFYNLGLDPGFQTGHPWRPSLDRNPDRLYLTYRLWNLSVMRDLNVTFAALADPTRRAILARLAKGEASVTDLARPFAMSQPAISKHLKVLERAGLISRGRDAQRRPRRLEARPLRDATQWLEGYRQFWEAQFQRLDHLLRDLQTGDPKIKNNNIKKKKSSR
jgi:DNA-binding transcriptional ArsR family regulator